MSCLCQSGENYDACCGRFISHQAHAENAQQLMRSRYTAYVLNDLDYLLFSWHQDFHPKNLQLDQTIKWLGLDVIEFLEHDNAATVEFEALLLVDGKVESMREKSQFVYENKFWLYTTGKMVSSSSKSFKPGRNESCPCASGLKFKRCCGK